MYDNEEEYYVLKISIMNQCINFSKMYDFVLTDDEILMTRGGTDYSTGNFCGSNCGNSCGNICGITCQGTIP